MNDVIRRPERRSFLRTAAAGGATVGVGLLASSRPASAGGNLTNGDVSILRFLAAVEIIETDLWLQYAELGGHSGQRTDGTYWGQPDLYQGPQQPRCRHGTIHPRQHRG